MATNQDIGKFGESEVTQYLIRNGYKIITNNFICKFGEIDIIAKDVKEQEIVFIEVKTRNSNSYGVPSEAVTKLKKKHIINTAKYFIYIHKLENEFIRLDVIEVYLNKDKSYKINHIKQAFWA